MSKEAGGAHYGKVDPFVLTRVMPSSGNAHVDGCRCAGIKYFFRKKGDKQKMIDDLRKAEHYAKEAAETLEVELAAETYCKHCGEHCVCGKVESTIGALGQRSMGDDYAQPAPKMYYHSYGCGCRTCCHL